MRKSRFTDEQIIGMLHEHEAGAKIPELCRRYGVTDTTFHRWKRKFGGLQVSEAKRLRQLEEENRQLQRIVADQGAESPGGQGSPGKKVVTPEHRRTAVTYVIETAELSERQACRYTDFARSSQRYRTRRPPRTELRERLQRLAMLRPRWGYRRLYILLRREGYGVNRKLVQRLYREEGLGVRRRGRKRVAVLGCHCPCRRDPTSAGASTSSPMPSPMDARSGA